MHFQHLSIACPQYLLSAGLVQDGGGGEVKDVLHLVDILLVSDPLPLSELLLEFWQQLESSDQPPRELLEDCSVDSLLCLFILIGTIGGSTLVGHLPRGLELPGQAKSNKNYLDGFKEVLQYRQFYTLVVHIK